MSAHKVIYPILPTREKGASGSHVSLTVVQGSAKNEPFVALHHVVYAFNGEGHRESLTIYRSTDLAEAIDFCRRCEECRVLLRLLGLYFIKIYVYLIIKLFFLDKRKDVRKSIRDITHKFQVHPLWR